MTAIEALERRVATLEQEVEGEKIVSRYILEQTRRNGDDLAALRARVDRIEAKVDNLAKDNLAVRAQVERLQRDLDRFRADLPAMIGDTLRDVLREERR